MYSPAVGYNKLQATHAWVRHVSEALALGLKALSVISLVTPIRETRLLATDVCRFVESFAAAAGIPGGTVFQYYLIPGIV
jgi:hypothetical protein